MEIAGSVVGPYWGDFEQFLRDRRYQPSTAHQYVVHCQTFDSFLVDRNIALASLQQSHIEEFVQKKLAARPHRNDREAAQRWHRPINLLVEHLSGRGRVSIFPRPAVSDPAILAEYLGFLRDHRGTCQQTVGKPAAPSDPVSEGLCCKRPQFCATHLDRRDRSFSHSESSPSLSRVCQPMYAARCAGF